MEAKPHFDPELTAVVERSRELMAATGEWPRPVVRFESAIPPEAVAVITAWLDDGSYDRAIAQITTEDPDLASQ